jgi:hypothetical protein
MQPIELNEMFELAFRFVTETSENIFLTGKAGTGKTTFLKYLKENSTKNIIVAAPTGVAAINAGGVTLHSLFQLPFHPFLPTKNNREELLARIRYNKQRRQLLGKMELLVIDEISMVRSDVMDAIDTILKSVRRKYDQPFGGVQLLCIGDLHQLPPVVQNQEWNILKEYYASPFFFDSNVVKEQLPLLIELNTIYRQKEEHFVTLLNKVRNNALSQKELEELHIRYDPAFKPGVGENYITLTTHNKQAELTNRRQLHQLLAAPFTYNAIIENDFPENMYPADASLVLKEGAQVMFLKNDTAQRRYFNGKIGIIKLLDKDKIIVCCDGTDIQVEPETWENTRYALNRGDGKLEQQTLGTFMQYPLRLAWAITIHKSQGLTFEKVMIDAGEAFSSGQVYVALSRCTSLNGLVLLSKIPSSAIYNNENVIKAQKSFTHKGSLAERFAGARQIFTLQLLEELFSFDEISAAIEQLQFQVLQNLDKLNDGAKDWTAKLKHQFDADKNVGLKFIGLIHQLMKEEGVIEKNRVLQKRISDAAHHFTTLTSGYLNDIKNHPLVTEHKEAADNINEYLQQLQAVVYSTDYYLQYCKQPFSVTLYLQHKLNFSMPRFNISCYASGKKEVVTDIQNKELYETLKSWRDRLCGEAALPIYMVANQASLKDICVYLPLNKKDLQQISGFGKTKAEKYGDEIIEAVENYCAKHNLGSNMAALANNPKKVPKEKSTASKTDTRVISFTLFKAGKSIAEIAKERKLTIGTIEGHLAKFVGSGEIDIDSLVSREKQGLIKDAAEKYGKGSLTTLVQNLPDYISYGEIRITLATIKDE